MHLTADPESVLKYINGKIKTFQMSNICCK